jgi:hypothetical protein
MEMYKNHLSEAQCTDLIRILKKPLRENTSGYKNIDRSLVETKLSVNKAKLSTLNEMEHTGYHKGAQTYYGAGGVRGLLRL